MSRPRAFQWAAGSTNPARQLIRLIGNGEAEHQSPGLDILSDEHADLAHLVGRAGGPLERRIVRHLGVRNEFERIAPGDLGGELGDVRFRSGGDIDVRIAGNVDGVVLSELVRNAVHGDGRGAGENEQPGLAVRGCESNLFRTVFQNDAAIGEVASGAVFG